MKVSISLIDPNPYQTRQQYDTETVAGIAASALGRHGILQPPMVRPLNGRYQIVFGHGRVRAAKAAGFKELDCRVEDVSDAEMRRYMGQENELRSDFSESERMAWLEQVRMDEGLDPSEYGFYAAMNRATNLPSQSLHKYYKREEVRARIKVSLKGDFEVPPTLIDTTAGLDPEDQDKLIIKALDKGWSSDTAFKVKTVLKELDSNVRLKILDKDTKLTWKTIIAIKEIEKPEAQLELIKFIQTRRIDEDTALQLIEDIKKGIPPILEIDIKNEYQRTFDKFKTAYTLIDSWGFNHYQIVKDHWEQVDPILTAIENKIQEFRRFHRA